MTRMELVARACGLATHLVPDDALAAVRVARDRAALVAAGFSQREPGAVEDALAARAAAELAIVLAWAGDHADALAPLVDDEDRRSLRAIVRGLGAGVPAARRLVGTIPTPQLPDAALRALAAAPSGSALAAALLRREHPLAAALAAPLAAAPLDVLAVELALDHAWAARARAVRELAMAVHVAQVIDADNAAAALALAARGRDLDAAACFVDGGARLSRAVLVRAAGGDLEHAREALARALAGSRLAGAITEGGEAIAAAALDEQLATQARLRRTEPDSLAAVIWLVLRRRRELRIVRGAAWRLAMGGPS